MIYTLHQLQGDVMARLGEISGSLPSLPASAVPAPADIVALKAESMLPEIGKRILREAPLEMLGAGMLIDVEVASRLMPCGMYAAEVVLPEDFLRLVSVKMSVWCRSAVRLVSSGDVGWECQWSEEPGIAGCSLRPRVYLVADGEGLMLRMLGSEESGATLEWLRGWRVPTSPAFHFPSLLYPDLASALAVEIASGI